MMHEQWLTFPCLMIWKMFFSGTAGTSLLRLLIAGSSEDFVCPGQNLLHLCQQQLSSQQDASVASLCMFKSYHLCSFRHGYISDRSLAAPDYYGTRLRSAQQLNRRPSIWVQITTPVANPTKPWDCTKGRHSCCVCTNNRQRSEQNPYYLSNLLYVRS